VIAAIVAGLLMVPTAAWAVHQYTDVPTNHTFHDAISALTEAGIASGTGGGLYKPQDPVTRGQMAAFIHRSAGRAAVQPNLANFSSAPGATLLGSASLKLVGPVGAAQGVLVEVAMQLDHDGALGSGCFPQIQLRKSGSVTVIDAWTTELYADGSGHEESVAATFYTTQGSGSTATYQIYGDNDCGVTLFTDEDMLIVQNIPFAGDGTGVSVAGVADIAAEEENREE
jgi:hypothetical protein